jgi:hypothetical protein
VDAEAGTRHSETLRTDIRPKNPTPLGVGDVNNYQVVYEERFVRNLKRYSSLRQRIRRKMEQILVDPYDRTERLGRVSGGLDLRGCRSSRIDEFSDNFRYL